MNTRFAIRTYTGSEWLVADEEHLASRFDEVVERLRGVPQIDGILEIESEGTELEVGDMLMTLVKRLCFDAVTTLCGTDRDAYVYTFFNESSVSVLAKTGDSIVLLSEDADEMAPLRCKAAELLPALFRVGRRFEALQAKLDEAGLPPSMATQELENAANRARAALQRAGMTP